MSNLIQGKFDNLIQTKRIDILKEKMLDAPRYASIEQARINYESLQGKWSSISS